MTRPTNTLVLAMLGTDHHRFDRLISWLDDLVMERVNTRVVVQHGHSAAPARAQGRDFIAYGELTELIGRADAIVCHGGPGTIMDARNAGHRAICVPRDPAFGEHVDGHQIAFARRMAQAGVVDVAHDQHEFRRLIEERLSQPRTRSESSPRLPEQRSSSGIAVLADELDSLLKRGPVKRSESIQRFLRPPKD